MRPIVALSIAILSMASSIYLVKTNGQLRHQLQSQARLSSSSVNCILPSLDAVGDVQTSGTLTFPRSKPLLIYSIREGCIYCDRNWPAVEILRDKVGGRADLIVYAIDGRRPTRLSSGSLKSKYSLFYPGPSHQFANYMSRTPSIVLLSQAGMLLNRWMGQFSKDTVDDVVTAVDLDL